MNCISQLLISNSQKLEQNTVKTFMNNKNDLISKT